jgi:hypothetical protein
MILRAPISLFSCFCVIITLFVSGCEGHFVPSPPRAPVVTDEATARIVRLDLTSYGRFLPGDSRVMVEIDEAADGARIVEGSLAKPGESTCGGQRPASSIATDDDLPGKAIHAGSRVTFSFNGRWRAVTDSPSRLDILVMSAGYEKCLTLDLTSEKRDEAWTYEHPIGFGLSLTMSAFTSPVLGARASVQSLLTMGIWRGPVRITAASGIAADICAADGCDRDVAGYPFELRVDTFPIQREHVALGFGARYSFVAMANRLDEGSTVAAYHGVLITPILAYSLSNQLGMGIPGGVKRGSIALEIPIGVVSALTDYRHPALSLGAGFSLGF